MDWLINKPAILTVSALLLIAVMALDMQAIGLAPCGFLPDDVSGLEGMTLGYVQAAFSFRGKGRMCMCLGRRDGQWWQQQQAE